MIEDVRAKRHTMSKVGLLSSSGGHSLLGFSVAEAHDLFIEVMGISTTSITAKLTVKLGDRRDVAVDYRLAESESVLDLVKR